MRRIVLPMVLILALATPGWGATTNFYINSAATYGGDGTTTALTGAHAAWKYTYAINWTAVASAVAAATHSGDYVGLNFARGGTWSYYLAVRASGNNGHPIKIRPYDTGDPPTFDPLVQVPANGWTDDGGGVWHKSIEPDGANAVKFGTLWGYKRTSTASIAYPRDWYYSNSKLYVYCPAGYSGGPDAYYGSGGIYVHQSGGMANIDINNQSYIDIQGFRLLNNLGVYVRGTSDHIGIYANYIEGNVPSQTYVGISADNASSTDIKIYNNDTMRCYTGIHTDGNTTADIRNCRVYFNRTWGLLLGSANATYSYNHLFCNGLDTNAEKSVDGGTAGSGNLSGADNLYQSQIDPRITTATVYPPYVGIRVDDPDVTTNYIEKMTDFIAAVNAAGMKLTHGIVSYQASQIGSLPYLKTWAADGQSIASHSWSHTSLGATQGFTLKYNNSATTATVTISGSSLKTTINGVDDLILNLTTAPYNILTTLVDYFNNSTGGKYTAALIDGNAGRSGMHTVSLADQTHDIKSTSTVTIDATRLANDETLTSKQWLDANITANPNGVAGYQCLSMFYPGNLKPSSDTPAITAGYLQTMGGQTVVQSQVLSYGVPVYSIPNVYPSGGEVITQAQIEGFVRSFVYRSRIYGIPYTLEFHPDTDALSDFTAVVNALAAEQGYGKTLDQMGAYLRGLSVVRNTTSYSGPETGSFDPRPTGASPTNNAGVDVGLVEDILGNPIIGIPDIGAYEFQGPNTSPVVTITSPANGSTFSYGSVINFSGTATDAQGGDLSSTMAWSSNIDGNLGTGSGFPRVLSPGTHTITASATDPGGLTGSATVTLTVTGNTAPVVTINGPANGATVPAGTAIIFIGTAIDAESGNLTSSLTWTSSLDGNHGHRGQLLQDPQRRHPYHHRLGHRPRGLDRERLRHHHGHRQHSAGGHHRQPGQRRHGLPPEPPSILAARPLTRKAGT